MKYCVKTGLMFAALMTSTGLWAQQATACLDQFYQQVPPVLQKESLKKDTDALCFNGFNAMHSGVSKTSLWVAEALTPERLSQKIPRKDSFHEEDRVSEKNRATLADYRGSGYDRGHMAPNADMPNSAAQHDSFSLANMVPQTPQNNQQVWRELEEATRALVTKQKQDVYVLTGPIYAGKNIKTVGKNKVLVPTSTYKAIYIPKTGVIGAYVVNNDMKVEKPQVELLSVCALEDQIGINLFPQLSTEQKRVLYDLPLTGSAVKNNQKIAQLKTDSTSKCAPEVKKSDIEALQVQFQPDATYIANQGSEDKKKETVEENSSSESSVWVNILKAILQFIMQLFK